MSRGNFYGDGNNVDFSQRHAQSSGAGGGEAADNSGGDTADRWLGILRKAEPNHWAWKDDQQSKRVLDEIRMALSGKGTTPEDDALLRQETPEDEYTHQAERMTRDMERRNIPLGQPRNQFVEGMAERLRGRPAQPAQPQEEQEEPALNKSADDKFWSNPEEVKKAGRAVRPRRL